MPASAPASLAVLGYGGLVPFAALAGVCAVLGGNHPWSPAAAKTLVSWGAVILSFVGAVHWGLQIANVNAGATRPHTATLLVAVLPAVVGCIGATIGGPVGAWILIAGFISFYAWERWCSRRVTIADWYLTLRLRLTAGACLALAVGTTAATVPA